METYQGYNITKFKDYFRSLIIIKNRYGPSNKEIPLFFVGSADDFTQLPAPTSSIEIEAVYSFINSMNIIKNQN